MHWVFKAHSSDASPAHSLRFLPFPRRCLDVGVQLRQAGRFGPARRAVCVDGHCGRVCRTFARCRANSPATAGGGHDDHRDRLTHPTRGRRDCSSRADDHSCGSRAQRQTEHRRCAAHGGCRQSGFHSHCVHQRFCRRLFGSVIAWSRRQFDAGARQRSSHGDLWSGG